jgi:hypothetical protein
MELLLAGIFGVCVAIWIVLSQIEKKLQKLIDKS